VANQLRTSAHDVGPAGLDPFYGFGVLDGYAALGGGRLAASPQPAGDALEPNGTAARATLMASSASATISPEGDADWFAVDLASPATITWTVVPPASNEPLAMDPILEVYDKDLRLLGRVDSFGDGQSETIAVGGAVAGRYRLRVTNYVGSRSPGPYTVNVGLSSATSTSSGSLLWVSDTSPPDFAQRVARTVHPTVTFARTTDASSFTASSVLLFNGNTGAILAPTLSYDAPSRTLTITPAALLAANTPFVVLLSGVRDTNSNVMPSSSYVAFRFTTGP
jgi:serine protease